MSPAGSSNAPEARARARIDQALTEAGWTLQDRDDIKLAAADAIAVREFKLDRGHGYVDYMLFLDGHPVGVCEAKPAGTALIGVEHQVKKYVEGIPPALEAPYTPLPFAYLSTGEETLFINHFDPHPRTRPVFSFHRPDTLREWLMADTLDAWLKQPGGFYTAADDTKPSTLRARLRAMPPVELPGMWPNKVQAVASVEKSLFDDRPRSLIQMATGSGKTLLAVTTLYRLIKFGGARRVLFLVDRANLGEQAEKEFQGFRTPDDNRLFTELYGIQRLTSNTIGSSSKVVISTIQRLYSILKGEPELDPEAEEHSDLDSSAEALAKAEPLPVVYNPAVPPEFFDVIFIDECHRSIYSLWRQVLEYFDAHLIGLTATPAKHTYGFFNQNVVMEYPHAQAVADGVNCDYEVYRIRTQITAAGSTIEAAPGTMVGYRDRQTRKTRWEAPDEDVTYAAGDLDKNVVAIDQIRLIVQTFRDKVLKETFPERTEVPKTLIFAKDDSHAEDIVRIVREEFGKGNEFAQKITYKVTGASPKDLIQAFRNSYYPRVVVTVDLIATGTDIKPVEIVMFMRSLKSRVLFEQMKGRGVRVINADDLKAVTPDARAKTHFLIVDCVGVTEHALSDTRPLEKTPTISLRALLDHVAANGTNDDYLSSLASRISRIDKQCDADDRTKVDEASGGVSLASIAAGLVHAIDDDVQEQAARTMFDLPHDVEPSDEQIRKAAEPLKRQAIHALMSRPALRKLILDLRHKFEQVVDEVSKDQLIVDQTGYSPEARDKAAALVHSFEQYLVEHKDEIGALQFFYAVPHRKRLRYADIKALADAIQAPPRQWTPEKLWRAYETLEKSKVRGAGAERLLTDVVSLVRFALHQDGELVPHAERVQARFLLSAHRYIEEHHKLDKDQKKALRYDALRGIELVDGVARLCAMNLFLHGIGPDDDRRKPPIKTDDALRNEPNETVDVVLTNPPFGKKSSITVVNDEGETDRETITYSRPDFWTTTSNKQLNFVQHVKSMLKIHGRAAVVVPDNVLFEGGAGEKIRRKLLQECEVHTLLRLPTGIFYAQGVKANVLFFDRKPGAKAPWTKKVWLYDLRTNKDFTLKTRRMTRADLDDFVACYNPANRNQRKAMWSEKHPGGRWRAFTYDEIVARDKCSLDIFWLKDESLEDSANLSEPHVLAEEIADDLRSALEQIESVLADLQQRVGTREV